MVGIHQPNARRDDAVAVGVGIIAHSYLVVILQIHQARHRVGARTIHPDFPVVIERHELKSRIDLRIDHRQVQPVSLANGLPVRDCRTACRVNADIYETCADCFHVDNFDQIIDIGRQQIFLMNVDCTKRSIIESRFVSRLPFFNRSLARC